MSITVTWAHLDKSDENSETLHVIISLKSEHNNIKTMYNTKAVNITKPPKPQVSRSALHIL
jgi:hypothetical protein